jgi:hypothetical protein
LAYTLSSRSGLSSPCRVWGTLNIPKGEKEDDKMETKKIMATFAILMMALGGAGFAYAQWSQTLYITGIVSTGNICVTFSDAWTNDPAGSNDTGLKNAEYVNVTVGEYWDEYAISGDYGCYEKDVAKTTAEISTGTEESDTLTIIMCDVYPSYAPEIVFLVSNNAEIPVFMDDFIISCDGLEGEAAAKQLDLDGIELIAWEVTLNGEHVNGSSKGTYTNLPFPVDETDEGLDCFNDLIDCLMDQQIDGGDYLDVHLIFHIEEWIDKDGYFLEFGITATFTQWNLVD